MTKVPLVSYNFETLKMFLISLIWNYGSEIKSNGKAKPQDMGNIASSQKLYVTGYALWFTSECLAF